MTHTRTRSDTSAGAFPRATLRAAYHPCLSACPRALLL